MMVGASPPTKINEINRDVLNTSRGEGKVVLGMISAAVEMSLRNDRVIQMTGGF